MIAHIRKISNFFAQRSWERAVLERGALPWSVRMTDKVTNLPIGHALLFLFCMGLFGYDFFAGALRGFNVYGDTMAEGQKNIQRKKEEIEAQQEMMDVHKDARAGKFQAARLAA